MQVEWKQSLHLGQIWGGLCGILKEAMGRTDRKDYRPGEQQGSLGRKEDLEDGWGGVGSLGEQAEASEHPSSGRQWESYLSDQHAFINTV